MPKTKISVTVDSDLVKQLDEIAVDRSRSEIVELALSRWLRDRKLEALSSAVEDYYRSMTSRERREDSQWAQMAADAIDEPWGE